MGTCLYTGLASGLVGPLTDRMILPLLGIPYVATSLDGAGPEHSSSRLERMLQVGPLLLTLRLMHVEQQLQLTNDAYDFSDRPANVNMHVVFPTTPAQYFHLLRRQMRRNYRKPLVVASPKGLLRLSVRFVQSLHDLLSHGLQAASSSLYDLEANTRFQPVLDDAAVDKSKVERVLCLSGKLYYELAAERQRLQLDNVALVRIEELTPFPFAHLAHVLSQYKQASKFVWVQEEPRNQGAWSHVSERLNTVLQRIDRLDRVSYIGRAPDAVPAPGTSNVFSAQRESTLQTAFSGL